MKRIDTNSLRKKAKLAHSEVEEIKKLWAGHEDVISLLDEQMTCANKILRKGEKANNVVIRFEQGLFDKETAEFLYYKYLDEMILASRESVIAYRCLIAVVNQARKEQHNAVARIEA